MLRSHHFTSIRAVARHHSFRHRKRHWVLHHRVHMEPEDRVLASGTTSQSCHAIRNLRPRTGANDVVAAQTAVHECRLLSLPPALMGLVWPAERGVVGMRVCKQLRRDLLVDCRSIVLTHKTGAFLSKRCISKDFRRLPKCALVTMKLKKGNWIKRLLLGALGECKTLAHLDLSSAKIGHAGARVLAGVLGGCTALAHLDLRAKMRSVMT